MEKEPKPVIYSTKFKQDIIDIYQYGIVTFGKMQADKYESDIYRLVGFLDNFYDIYPDCRYLRTKSKMYRWTYSNLI